VTLSSMGASTAFLAMGTQYPRTMGRGHRWPDIFRLSAEAGKYQVGNAICCTNCNGTVLNAPCRKGLPPCAG
jgi:hypothetical protein